MAELEHLSLLRVGKPEKRRTRAAFFRAPDRDRPKHGKKLAEDASDVVSEFRKSTPPDAVNPSLILKVRLASPVADDEWPKSDLRVLAHTGDNAVILFASDAELRTFCERAKAYEGGPRGDSKNAPYSAFFDAIDGLEPLSPEDRIGPGLASQGFAIEALDGDESTRLDVELWRPEGDEVEAKLGQMIRYIESNGGKIISEYRAPTGLLLRVEGPRGLFGKLLQRSEVAEIDIPPAPDLEEAGLPRPDLEEVGEYSPPARDAVCIGIIDSGINDGHPLLEDVVAGSFGLGGLSANDECGHGTAVAGLATYGDVDANLRRGSFAPRFRIASARVVDANGRFPDDDLAPGLIEEAIRRLHGEFGCRVINISLADPSRPVGARATLWSEALDTLSRELDVLIVVSAGNTNRTALTAAHGPGVVRAYPSYLLEPANRIYEPAGALNALTVGAIAHVNGLSAEDADRVEIQPIAGAREPAPFTRAGLGLARSIKPDLVDFGGTAVHDGLTQKVQDGSARPAAGLLSLHHKPAERLFTSYSGTSFAAPIVAWKAAVLLERYPKAPATFLRSLLGLSAVPPSESIERLASVHKHDVVRVVGNGLADIEHALFSDDDRVVLYTDDAIEPNTFVIYELPIPKRYQSVKGIRTIDISLAFDPPVRRTRRDYPGFLMQYDLVRGCSVDQVYEAYQALDPDSDEEPENLPGNAKCKFEPGMRFRSKGSLQRARFQMKRDISKHGDTYFIVLRCFGRWATDHFKEQRFTLSVMLTHQAQVSLYAQLRQLIRLRSQA